MTHAVYRHVSACGFLKSSQARVRRHSPMATAPSSSRCSPKRRQGAPPTVLPALCRVEPEAGTASCRSAAAASTSRFPSPSIRPKSCANCAEDAAIEVVGFPSGGCECLIRRTHSDKGERSGSGEILDIGGNNFEAEASGMLREGASRGAQSSRCACGRIPWNDPSRDARSVGLRSRLSASRIPTRPRSPPISLLPPTSSVMVRSTVALDAMFAGSLGLALAARAPRRV